MRTPFLLAVIIAAAHLTGCATGRALTGVEALAVRSVLLNYQHDGVYRANAVIERFGNSLAFVSIVRVQGASVVSSGITPAGASLYNAGGKSIDSAFVVFTALVPAVAREHLLFAIEHDLRNIYAPPESIQELRRDENGDILLTERREDASTVLWRFQPSPFRIVRKTHTEAGLPAWEANYLPDGSIDYSRSLRNIHLRLTPQQP